MVPEASPVSNARKSEPTPEFLVSRSERQSLGKSKRPFITLIRAAEQRRVLGFWISVGDVEVVLGVFYTWV